MENRYEQAHRRSIQDPEGFWAEAAEQVHWHRKWDRVLDDSRAPFARWFPGGEINTCHNALDVHVEKGFGDRLALIYDSPVTGMLSRYTYAQLLEQVAVFAGALAGRGIRKGDRVLIYMPMVPEAVVAMLACARLGAVHSVVFGGFAANELAVRINDARPRVVLSASCGIEVDRVVPYKPLLDRAIAMADHKPEACIILQRPQEAAPMIPGRDLDWREAAAAARPHPCVPVASTDPLYILYTSGTTGVPKGVVRDNGGHAVALNWSMKHVYNREPGDVFWAASDVGWVVGHSYIVYGPLLRGCTTVLFEGKPVRTPDAGAFWRVVSYHRVNTLFTAPTALRAIKREDPEGERRRPYDLSSLESLFLAGERLDPDTLRWAEQLLDIPVIDHWWQTETGWPVAANCLGLHPYPVKQGSPARPAPGWDIQVLDPSGHPLAPGETGALAARLPLPPGSFPTLWENEEGYVNSYFRAFPGYYHTGDAGFVDEDGYVYVMSRMDDIINVAGHRLSTGGMEEVLSAHPDVAECAVLGVADRLKGQVPVGLLVLKAGVDRPPESIVREAVRMMREQMGPVASFKLAAVVQRLPKTRSGKILRGVMRKIADGEAYRVPATIDDPVILDEIREAMQAMGLAPAPGDRGVQAA